jgi:hypothetical protein
MPSNGLKSSEPIDVQQLPSLIDNEKEMFAKAILQKKEERQKELKLNRLESLKRQSAELQRQEEEAKTVLLKIQNKLVQCRMEINNNSSS